MSRWSPYVPVAKRCASAKQKVKALRNKGKHINPIEITGKTITKTFWGKAWCSHLEGFSDYENRLPRGRTYVRNGSVCHLDIEKGRISAMVSGSHIYQVEVAIKPLQEKRWRTIQEACSGGIGSLLELLQGKLSDNVMKTVTDPMSGLFPRPREIEFTCDCPDWAGMCKHIAAVFYGIGARLDYSPELLFVLRGVNHQDLIAKHVKISQPSGKKSAVIGDLSSIFGIDLDEDSRASEKPTKPIGQTTVRTDKNRINISRGIRASHIKKLRAEFQMTQSEFATLTGKSTATVANWEARKGVLKLQTASREILQTVFAMDKEQACRQLACSN